MKLIKIFRRLNSQFLTKLPNNDVYLKSLVSLSILAALAAAIWVGGPSLIWEGYAPLVQPEKRIYVIIFLFLIWLLKLLVLDLDVPNPFQYKDALTRKKLSELQSRFYGALQFLKKTTLSKQGKTISLDQLPWHLLIGPKNAGKTSLLANSGINFILQRRSPKQDISPPEASESCDWWVTRDTTIVDIPGKYLSTEEGPQNRNQKSGTSSVIWRFFLRLLKKKPGGQNLGGLIIALPLPETMKQGELKHYQAQLRSLFQHLHELHKTLPQTMPCQLVITKCDLLSGFTEFFAETGNDEITQAWGITLAETSNGERIHDLFTQRFDALIKKLNQQLLWRLHQERNPIARPHIKDFPLQVEQLKELITDFVKKFSAEKFNLSLQSVYLTSALQNTQAAHDQHETIDAHQHAVQIFNEPPLTTRAYFIKQFITHGLVAAQPGLKHAIKLSLWKRRTAYATSIIMIGFAAILLGKDFERGLKQSYSIQNDLSDYHHTIKQATDPNEHLLQTIYLLNALQESANNSGLQLDSSHLLTFYSEKSQQKAQLVYRQALATLLIPEVKNYLGEYLDNPVNKNTEYVYGALKSYLMMGDASHFDASFISNMVKAILPKSLNKTQVAQVMHHVTLALDTAWNPLLLDANLVDETRNYFIAMPELKLSYIILKNNNYNNSDTDINLGIMERKNPIFISRQVTNRIPFMFTGKAFFNILSQETTLAAQEAVLGNWILGADFGVKKNPGLIPALIEQLRLTYVNNYIDIWESLIANIHLSTPSSITQINTMILDLTSNESPLLQLLQTLRDNTYFEPIISASPKLQNLGSLLDKTTSSETMLYEIFSSLQSLRQHLINILSANNERRAAFEAVANRMQNARSPDALTQVRLVANKSPEPVKNWLDQIANDAWNFLMQDASGYLDTSWQNNVIHFYQSDIANRYPFSSSSKQEVELQKFVHFFGNPGIVLNFYHNYLQALVDTSAPDWRWKSIDDKKLPFSDETLRKIQHAMRIHHTFFPNNDDKLYVQFTLQPYKFGDYIKRVKLNINDKEFTDDSNGIKDNHVVAWPSSMETKSSSVQLTLGNQATINHNFPGVWGWFKLVNDSFESTITKKEMLINLSTNEHSAQYRLFTTGKFNPFTSLNLRHFSLPLQVSEQQKA